MQRFDRYLNTEVDRWRNQAITRFDRWTSDMGFSPLTENALSYVRMSLFESFNVLLNRGDDRILEHQSVRSVFLWLLILLFLLGADAGLALYRFFHHRFDWTDLLVIVGLGIICYRSARMIYRRLDA